MTAACPDEPLRKGMFVHLTFDGRTVLAVVALVSENGRSLIFGFEALLGGYAGAMPVALQDDGTYVDLFHGRSVVITPAWEGQ